MGNRRAGEKTRGQNSGSEQVGERYSGIGLAACRATRPGTRGCMKEISVPTLAKPIALGELLAKIVAVLPCPALFLPSVTRLLGNHYA